MHGNVEGRIFMCQQNWQKPIDAQTLAHKKVFANIPEKLESTIGTIIGKLKFEEGTLPLYPPNDFDDTIKHPTNKIMLGGNNIRSHQIHMYNLD